MSIGPAGMLVDNFFGNKLTGEISPALADLIDNGLSRVIDLLCVIKGEVGTILDASDVEPNEHSALR